MTIRELIKALQDQPDQEAQVVLMRRDYDFGDVDLCEIDNEALQPLFVRSVRGRLEWCSERSKGAAKAFAIWL